jgi:hypothetical protein
MAEPRSQRRRCPSERTRSRAVYREDDNFITSTSAVLKQKVKQSSDVSIAGVSSIDPADIVQSLTATATYEGVFTASARASSRIMAGLASGDGLWRGRPPVDRRAGSGDARPAVQPTAAVFDVAIGTLQDDVADTTHLDELAGDLIAVRSRRRVR